MKRFGYGFGYGDGTLESYAVHTRGSVQLDLDDGVKVNYGKFGDLLAEVKAVTGGEAEDA